MLMNVPSLQLLFSVYPAGLRVADRQLGWRPYHWATHSTRFDALKWMLEVCPEGAADPDGQLGMPAVHWAAFNGRIEPLLMLLTADPECIRLRDARKRIPLHCAAEMNQKEAVRILIAKFPQGVNDVDFQGWTPLQYACRVGNVDVSKMLFEVDSKSAFIPDSAQGMTAFHWATQSKRAEVLRLLLSVEPTGAMTKDKNGSTPFHWAAQLNHEDVMAVLIEASPEGISIKDTAGRTALDWASDGTDRGPVKQLLLAAKSSQSHQQKNSKNKQQK